MTLEVCGFEVLRVVMHDVPPPDVGTHGPLVLTDERLSLDEELRSYFSRKVVESPGLHGLDVIAGSTCLYTVQTNAKSPKDQSARGETIQAPTVVERAAGPAAADSPPSITP